MSTPSNAINSGINALSNVSTTTSSTSSSSSAASAAGSNAAQQLAGNFDTFLQLLTTQLQNQNPLDPLDTNQFTQQLVEFASVEQQVNMNTNLQTLISMQQTSNLTITNSAGQTAFTGTMALNAGAQSFTWNGKGNNGQTWPDGTYTLTVTATGANGQAVNVSTQVQGTVSAVNTNANPPTLTVGGETVQISQVTSISH